MCLRSWSTGTIVRIAVYVKAALHSVWWAYVTCQLRDAGQCRYSAAGTSSLSITMVIIIHYNDIIIGAMASQITSLMMVYSTVYSGADQAQIQAQKTSKLRVTGLCAGNSPGTGEFPPQMASNAENVSIWWRFHGTEGWSGSRPDETGTPRRWGRKFTDLTNPSMRLPISHNTPSFTCLFLMVCCGIWDRWFVQFVILVYYVCISVEDLENSNKNDCAFICLVIFSLVELSIVLLLSCVVTIVPHNISIS